jgi:hypothetical protein
MPSAFSVGGSPVTTAGTLAVTGAGTVGQYIRGDGSLADFPATTGGGSSVSYYLNGSVSQGTIGGVAYLELNKMPVFGAGTDITRNSDGYIASFITDAGDPNKLLIPAGNWNLETYFSASSGGGNPSFYVELYKYNGTTFTLIASSSTAPELIAFGTNLNPYFSTLAVPETILTLTDRLALRYYVETSGRTITLHTENNHLCQVITTFTTGLTALNGLTNQVQFFAVGTSGTDFAISSASDTHTFNLPTASATNRGALSSADWTTFNGKTSNLGTVTSVGLSSATSGVTIGSTPVTTSGTITLAIATASGSQNGLLSSTDWTTFNGKQNALTNPVTGTGTSGTLPKFTGASTIGNSLFTDNGTHGAFGGANYSGGTDVRSFNISATLYAGLAFWANNQYAADIFGYGVTGNLILSADPTNIFTSSKIALAVDGTERFVVYNDGNVTISNTPTNSGFKLYVVAPSTAIATFQGATNGYVDISDGTVNSRLQNTAQGFLIGTVNSYNLNLRTNGTIRVTIDASTGAANFTNSITATSSIRIERASTTNSNALLWGTVGTADWYLGSSPLGNSTSDLSLYSYGTSSVVLNIVRSTGAATFISSVTSSFGSSGANFNSNAATTGSVNAYRASNSVGIGSFGIESDAGGNLMTFGLTNATLLQSISNTALQFGTNQTARLTILQGGNVGILTTNPNGRLSIRAQQSDTPSLTFQNGLGGPSTAISNYESAAQTFSMIGTNLYINSAAGFSRFDTGKQSSGVVFDEGILIFATGPTSATASNRMSINSTGVVTIANLGTGTVTSTAGVLSSVSDSSYKIEDGFIDSAIEKVLNLKPRYFYWNEKSGLPTDKRQLGFYAQEVNQALGEEAANTPQNENTSWGITDRSMIAMLTKAIQELKQEIDTLKN